MAALAGTFFIASLPRCRTAWLANLLTYGDAFCYHEALKYCDSTDALKTLLASTGTTYAGNSDSALPFFMDEVKQIFPESRLVIIERDPEEVTRSIEKVYPQIGPSKTGEIVAKTLEAIQKTKEKYPHLLVHFSDLNKMSTCEELWSYCLPHITFSEKRWQMLDTLAVEIIPEKHLKTMTEGALKNFQRVVKFIAS